MTFSPRNARSVASPLAATALVLALVGCGSSAEEAVKQPAAAESPTAAAAADLTADVVSGTGPTGWPGVEFPIPTGARSVTIGLTCDGQGRYTIELGDSMALGQSPVSGSCGTDDRLRWPITPRTGSALAVTVDDGVAWTAAPQFSTAEFDFDSALSSDCAAFTEVYSALINADYGLTHYSAFDATEWAERVVAVRPQLDDIAAESRSSIAAPLAEMARTVAAATEPGAALRGTEAAVAQVGAACDANQTPYYIKSEFGG